MTQLAINRLPLPEDIHTIIKNYALPTIERKKIMNLRKNIYDQIINADTFCIIHPSYNRLWFEIENEIYMNPDFCKKCGDYIYSPCLSSANWCWC